MYNYLIDETESMRRITNIKLVQQPDRRNDREHEKDNAPKACATTS